MNLLKKKMQESYAIGTLVETNQKNSQKTFPIVKEIIYSHGLTLKDEEEAIMLWFIGLLVLDTWHARQVFKHSVATRLINDVGYFLDFQIKITKEWPSIAKEMYDFYYYLYLRNETEFLMNKKRGEFPPITTLSAVIIHIIFGFKNSPDSDVLPPDSEEAFAILSETSRLAINQIGTWKTIDQTYKIVF